MKKHFIVFSVAIALGAAACGSKDKSSSNLSASSDAQVASYEIYCQKPQGPTGATGASGAANEIPDALPMVKSTVEVQSCPGLTEGKPTFFSKEMPGLVAIVDCNAKLVRFRTRDWQTNEASSIGPLGEIDLRVMYITRFGTDVVQNQNCWARLLGHITGNVSCQPSNSSGSTNEGTLTYHIDWHFDETPADIMEPAAPGVADLRNGVQCRIGAGNCSFSNDVATGCSAGGV